MLRRHGYSLWELRKVGQNQDNWVLECKYWTQVRNASMERKYGTQVQNASTESKYGTQVRNPSTERKNNKLITSLFYRPYLVLTKESLTLKVDLRGNSSVRCALQNIRALSRLVYWLMMQLVKIWNDHRLAILNLVEISLCITWNDCNLSSIPYLQKTMNIFS